MRKIDEQEAKLNWLKSVLSIECKLVSLIKDEDDDDILQEI